MWPFYAVAWTIPYTHLFTMNLGALAAIPVAMIMYPLVNMMVNKSDGIDGKDEEKKGLTDTHDA